MAISCSFQECYTGAIIANVYLTYILQFEGNSPPRDILQDIPFAKYSAKYWMVNAARAKDTNSVTSRLMEQLFCYSRVAYSVCYNLYQPDQLWLDKLYYDEEPVAPALYYAASGGLLNIVKCLSDQGANINVQGGYYGNALQATSSKGHEQIVRLLVDKGADVNAKNNDGWTLLMRAAYYGYKDTVKPFTRGCVSTASTIP